MKSIRQLRTNTKLFAVFALLSCLGAGLATWLLIELGHVAELGAQHGAIARAQGESAAIRTLGCVLLGADLGLALVLGLWLAGEVARPLREAVQAARRMADGDLGPVTAAGTAGEGGLLARTMQELAGKLGTMIFGLRSGSELIEQASGQIAASSMDLSARTEQQAASLEETASSMEQLTATVKQNADHAHQASKLAISASEVAVKGGEVVSEVVGTMASINDSSKRIAEIIGVIDGIAFQTNILALNAAVEAARAGEQGRGFAVVASEVRSLAQRSAAAAKEIKALIDDSVEKVNAGTLLADKAGSTMNEVVTSVKRVTGIIAEIADASAEQTAGIEQVNQAIAAMDQATQQNAALVEESAAAAASMREQAAGRTRVIGAFAGGAAPPAPSSLPRIAAPPAGNAPARGAASASASPRAAAGARGRPGKPAAPARPSAAPPAGAGRARGKVVNSDLDWEEF
jgi:methyl-accepting chemotaxis protein